MDAAGAAPGDRDSPAALPAVPAGADLAPQVVPMRWVALLCLLTFLVYLAFVPQIIRYSSPPTGDQPFYLMDTLSLVQDGDLELSNNYANRDEDKFYSLAPHPPDFVGMDAPYPLPRQLAMSSARPDQELYSFHPPGLGVLLVPAWIIGSWFALWWPATVVFMCLVGALLATNIFLLAYETTGKRWVALAVWAPLAFSGPLMSYSYMIFSELPAGLATIYAFRRLALGWRANGAGRLLLVGAAIGYIPWLAVRCLPIAAGLGLYALVQWWRTFARADRPALVALRARATWRTLAAHIPRALWLVAPVVVLAAGLAAYHLFLFGSVAPANDEREGSGVGWIYWPWAGAHELYLFLTGAFGLLFSRRFGLLPFAPIYLPAVVGVVAMLRTGRPADRRLIGWIALVSLPYMIFIAAYSGWGGDWGPPARYASTLVPLLAAPLALSLATLARSRVYQALYAGLALIGWAFMAVMLADPRTMFSGGDSAICTWIANDPASPLKIDLSPLVPNFFTPDEAWFPWRTGWLLAACILVVLLGVFLLQRHQAPAAARLPARARLAVSLGILVLLGAGWGVINYDFLRAKTTLEYVASWGIDAPLDSAGGIAYLDGKVYIAQYGPPGAPDQPGTVGVFTVATATYAELQPIGPDGQPMAWAHPGSVAVGPAGLLNVLNNGEGDQALLALTPDGHVVRQVALDGKSVLGMGLYFGEDDSLYVADQSRGVVLQYPRAGGAPLATLTGKESILNNPRGVAVDPQGNIYTTETFNRIQKLDKNGNLRKMYDLTCKPRYFADLPDSDEWLEASCSTGLVSINTKHNYVQLTHVAGDGPRPASPRGVTYGSDNTLYVLDGNTLFAYRVTH
jgi:DNA-binding beta-propeller fold protein YncE